MRRLTNWIVNLQFNPLGLRWVGSAIYAKHRPVGWSGERVQFLGNPNETRDLELFFAATDVNKFETFPSLATSFSR